jgi:hypothetical protein
MTINKIVLFIEIKYKEPNMQITELD